MNEAKTKTDEQAGYTAELKIPLSLFNGMEDELVCNVMLQNTDNGKKTERDTLSGTELSKPSTWYKVSFEK